MQNFKTAFEEKFPEEDSDQMIDIFGMITDMQPGNAANTISKSAYRERT